MSERTGVVRLKSRFAPPRKLELFIILTVEGDCRMRRNSIVLLFLIAAMLLPADFPARAAEEAAPLGEIVVTGDAIVTPTKQTNDTVYTGQEVTKKGMQIEGTKADTSVYEAIEILPGINLESVDPYGLAAEQKSVRTRGVRGYLGAMAVEGIPNYGGNPMGPRDYIYDMEDMRGIAIYKGAVPVDLGTGVGARGGAVELKPRWPEEKFGGDISTAFGSNNYTRTFFRLDSGTLPTLNNRFSLSYSFTDADKWKGPGDLGPRNNVNFMFEQPYNSKDTIKVWFNYNDIQQDLYQSLTYNETQSLDRNYRKDYNPYLTGIRNQDINYYKYNSANLTNMDIFAIVPITLNDSFNMNFKPYYSSEDSTILGGATSQGGVIQQRNRDIERFGIISDVNFKFSNIKATLGYWFEASNMIINVQNYNPLNFAYLGYGNYTDSLDDGYVHSPYFKLAGNLFNFDWQAGVKYFYYKDPATHGFLWNSTTRSLERATDLDRSSKEYDEFLPSVGLGYKVMDSLEFYANYGRNQIRPYAYQPLLNIYNQYRSRFQNAGVTLNDLFNGYNMEISDDFELGARYRRGWFEIIPTAFFGLHKNMLTTVYDPRVDLSYYQNIGKGTGYGVEVVTNLYINDNLTCFINPTYNVLTYDDDLTYQGVTLNTEGKQVVDTPEWMLKTGMIIKYRNFEFVPILRYVGTRYGDAEHKERVDDYVTMDLQLSYKLDKLPYGKSLKASLELYNLFDTKYVSLVNASDDSRAGSTGYYVGAPFTVLGKLSLAF